MAREGYIHAESSFPVSLTLIVAVLLLLIGLAAIAGIVFRLGPFDLRVKQREEGRDVATAEGIVETTNSTDGYDHGKTPQEGNASLKQLWRGGRALAHR